MSYNDLPPHIVTQILNQLDCKSQLRAMKAFDGWAEVFKTYPLMIKKFQVTLGPRFFSKWQAQELPDIPVENIVIDREFDCRNPAREVLQKYNQSIRCIAITDRYRSIRDNNITTVKRVDFTNLKTLKLTPDDKGIPSNFLRFFENCVSLEKLHIDVRNRNAPSRIHFFVMTFPNLKHLRLENMNYTYHVPSIDFPAKLETLEVSMLGLENSRFLLAQKDNLKQLYIHGDRFFKLDMMRDSRVLNFIFDNMNLEYFQYGDIKMIINFERQPESFLI